MSEQSAGTFAGKLGSDAAFRAGILAESSIEGRMRLARAAGLDCTPEDIASAAGMADDQLDGVTGGLCAPGQEVKPTGPIIL